MNSSRAACEMLRKALQGWAAAVQGAPVRHLGSVGFSASSAPVARLGELLKTRRLSEVPGSLTGRKPTVTYNLQPTLRSLCGGRHRGLEC